MAFPDFAGRSAAGLGRAAASAFLSACALAVRHDMGFGICPELAGLRPVLHRRALLLFLVTAAALLKPSCLDVFRASAVFFVIPGLIPRSSPRTPWRRRGATGNIKRAYR